MTTLTVCLNAFITLLLLYLTPCAVYESSSERWSPVQSIEKILLSVVSMLAEPNVESGANIDACVCKPPLWLSVLITDVSRNCTATTAQPMRRRSGTVWRSNLPSDLCQLSNMSGGRFTHGRPTSRGQLQLNWHPGRTAALGYSALELLVIV